MISKSKQSLCGFLSALLLFAAGTLGAHAATLTVTNNADSGTGSLRQAIADAVAGDTIVFDASLDGGTITLGGTELTIDKSLTINASALHNGITIDGNNASRLFANYPITTTLTLDSLNLTGGNSTGRGGAIGCSGSLTINNCSIFDNSALSGGGAINIDSSGGGGTGVVTLRNSTVSGNTAGSAGGSFRYGGGLSIVSGSLTLINSTISNNSAPEYAGGVYIQGSGTWTIGNSIIAGNTATLALNDIYDSSGSSGVTYVVNGANLIGEGNSNFPADGVLIGTSAAPVDPVLGALADNGGTTMTMLPLTGSPAIDATSTGEATDQRGIARPQYSDYDIGAVEIEEPTPLTAWEAYYQQANQMYVYFAGNGDQKAGLAWWFYFRAYGDQALRKAQGNTALAGKEFYQGLAYFYYTYLTGSSAIYYYYLYIGYAEYYYYLALGDSANANIYYNFYVTLAFSVL